MKLVQLTIYPLSNHFFFIFYSEIAEKFNFLPVIPVRIDQRPAFDRMEKFGGVKTEHRKIAKRADTCPVNLDPKSVGGIVDNL